VSSESIILQENAEEIAEKLKYDRGKTCAKCKEKEGKIVIRHTVFCKLIVYLFFYSLSDKSSLNQRMFQHIRHAQIPKNPRSFHQHFFL
jgi:hypothetical protein